MTRILAIIALLAVLAKFDAVAHHEGKHSKPEAEVTSNKSK